MMRMMDSKIMKASDFSSVFLILNNKMFKMAEKIHSIGQNAFLGDKCTIFSAHFLFGATP